MCMAILIYACHPHFYLFHRSPLSSKRLAFMIKRPLRYKHQHDITQTSLRFKAAIDNIQLITIGGISSSTFWATSHLLSCGIPPAFSFHLESMSFAQHSSASTSTPIISHQRSKSPIADGDCQSKNWGFSWTKQQADSVPDDLITLCSVTCRATLVLFD